MPQVIAPISDRKPNVGRSRITPHKHAILDSFLGAEGRLLSTRPYDGVRRCRWYDLDAGDGGSGGLDWRRNSSPALMAYRALQMPTDVEVRLTEINRPTYTALIKNYETNLAAMDYQRVGESEWTYHDRHHGVRLLLDNADGRDCVADDIDETDAVLIFHDPNSPYQWTLSPSLLSKVKTRAWCFRSLTTLGCNVGGGQRGNLDERLMWFDRIVDQQQVLPVSHDLLLVAVDRDDSKWGYLLCEPVSRRTTVEAYVRRAFTGRSVGMAWLLRDPREFRALQMRLFLTRREIENGVNPWKDRQWLTN